MYLSSSVDLAIQQLIRRALGNRDKKRGLGRRPKPQRWPWGGVTNRAFLLAKPTMTGYKRCACCGLGKASLLTPQLSHSDKPLL